MAVPGQIAWKGSHEFLSKTFVWMLFLLVKNFVVDRKCECTLKDLLLIVRNIDGLQKIDLKYSSKHLCRSLILVKIIFSMWFSFMNTHDSQDSMERMRLAL